MSVIDSTDFELEWCTSSYKWLILTIFQSLMQLLQIKTQKSNSYVGVMLRNPAPLSVNMSSFSIPAHFWITVNLVH